uniref:Formate acetyltransferase n=1 Tax=Panagrellus redivivus TaxID=6233 RepID=A0A7E4VZ60_PANRE
MNSSEKRRYVSPKKPKAGVFTPRMSWLWRNCGVAVKSPINEGMLAVAETFEMMLNTNDFPLMKVGGFRDVKDYDADE